MGTSYLFILKSRVYYNHGRVSNGVSGFIGRERRFSVEREHRVFYHLFQVVQEEGAFGAVYHPVIA